MLKNVVTYLFAISGSTEVGFMLGKIFGEIGYILILLGTFTEDLRRGIVSDCSLASF
jgi:hypothetical protein